MDYNWRYCSTFLRSFEKNLYFLLSIWISISIKILQYGRKKENVPNVLSESCTTVQRVLGRLVTYIIVQTGHSISIRVCAQSVMIFDLIGPWIPNIYDRENDSIELLMSHAFR